MTEQDEKAAEEYAWPNERKPKRKDGWFSGSECEQLEKRVPLEKAFLAGCKHTADKLNQKLITAQSKLEKAREALEKISSAKGFTRLADCCVDRTCHFNAESGSCSFQTGVYYANCDRAAEAEEALKELGDAEGVKG